MSLGVWVFVYMPGDGWVCGEAGGGWVHLFVCSLLLLMVDRSLVFGIFVSVWLGWLVTVGVWVGGVLWYVCYVRIAGRVCVLVWCL